MRDLDEWWLGLCVSMIHQAILVVVSGRTSHDRQVGGRNQTRKQPMSPPGLLEAEGRADNPTS